MQTPGTGMTDPWRMAVTAIAVAAVAVVVGLWLARPSPSPVHRAQVRMPVPVFDKSGADWPTLGGGPQHTGHAPGRLGDVLQLVWTATTSGPIRSSAAIVSDRLYIGSGDANLYCLDLATGRRLWAFRASDGIEADITAVDDKVLFGARDGWFYALSTDGSVIWRYQTGGQIAGAANWFTGLDGQVNIIIGSYDGCLYCLAGRNGVPIWSYKTDNYINGSPAIWSRVCVVGGCDSKVHIVSTDEGRAIGTVESGSYIAGPVAVKDGFAYVGNYAGVLLKIAIDTGQVQWRSTFDQGPILTCPAIHQGLVLFGCRDKKVHCLRDSDGTEVWAFQALGNVDSSPVICDQKVIFGSDDGRLYMLSLEDGRPLWSYQVGKPISASPAVAYGLVVVGCEDGVIYAFGQQGH